MYGGVADDHADLAAVLAADAADVVVAEGTKEVVHVTTVLPEGIGVVERIDKAKVRIFEILACNRGVSRFDVQIGNIVRQYRNFVGV